MSSNNIPTELRNLIDAEETDFIVKSGRNYPKKKAYGLIFFALFWNAFISIFVVAFLGPLLMGEEVSFKTNDVPTSASLDNWEPALVPALIIGLFVAVGIGMLIWSLVLLFQKGGFFVGTATRFIKYRNGEFTVKDWEQFSGNMKIKSKDRVGNIELELRTGKMKSKDKGADKFVPDIIYMSEIANVFDIEKKCRVRIKENDPTPTLSSTNNSYTN